MIVNCGAVRVGSNRFARAWSLVRNIGTNLRQQMRLKNPRDAGDGRRLLLISGAPLAEENNSRSGDLALRPPIG